MGGFLTWKTIGKSKRKKLIVVNILDSYNIFVFDLLGLTFQKGPCNTSWIESHLLPANTRCKKESLIPTIYNFGCYYQRYCHWSEREWVGPCDTRRQSYLGKTCPGYQQSWKWWMHKCSPAGLTAVWQVIPYNYWRLHTCQEDHHCCGSGCYQTALHIYSHQDIYSTVKKLK